MLYYTTGLKSTGGWAIAREVPARYITLHVWQLPGCWSACSHLSFPKGGMWVLLVMPRFAVICLTALLAVLTYLLGGM